jgi:hypothetical protein
MDASVQGSHIMTEGGQGNFDVVSAATPAVVVPHDHPETARPPAAAPCRPLPPVVRLVADEL